MSVTDPSQACSWTVLAKILRPQGRRGEILAELFTDFPERFSERSHIHLAKAGFTGDASKAREFLVTSSWLPVGKNAGRIVLKFAGIDSITEAEALTSFEVLVPESERMPLDPDTEYVSDLVGCAVWEGEHLIGVVDSVAFATTADGVRRLDSAAPLLALKAADEKEVLIPYVLEFVVEVDTGAKRIEMRLPPGLLNLND